MGALADPAVGDYVNAQFVSSFQKVGTFRVVDGQKQGGNVASYFCTPDGRVVHAVAGPVNAAVFLREARWAVEAYKMARLETHDEDGLRDFFRKAHAERLRQGSGVDVTAGRGGRPALNAQGKVHLLLAAAPLAKIEHVYKLVFEKVLGEQVSTTPVIEAGAAATPELTFTVAYPAGKVAVMRPSKGGGR